MAQTYTGRFPGSNQQYSSDKPYLLLIGFAIYGPRQDYLHVVEVRSFDSEAAVRQARHHLKDRYVDFHILTNDSQYGLWVAVEESG